MDVDFPGLKKHMQEEGGHETSLCLVSYLKELTETPSLQRWEVLKGLGKRS